MSLFDSHDLEVAKDLIKELRKSRESKEKIRIEEIDARDRVDISLSMYEELRNKIQEYYEESKKLKEENEKLKESFKTREDIVGLLLSRLEVPFEELKIDPASITGFVDNDIVSGKRKYLIKFTSEV